MQPHRERPGSLAQPQGGQTALQETLCRFGLFRFFSNPESNQCDKLSRCFTEILWKTTPGRSVAGWLETQSGAFRISGYNYPYPAA